MINLIKKIVVTMKIRFLILLFFSFLLGLSFIDQINSLKALAIPLNSVHLKKAAIEINDEKYSDTYAEIRTKRHEYKGKAIVVKGFVYKNPIYGKNNFLLARIYMYCCAADTQVVGYLSNSTQTDNLKEGQWLKATGIVDYKTYYEPLFKAKVTAPYLKITKIEKIKAPENQYVY